MYVLLAGCQVKSLIVLQELVHVLKLARPRHIIVEEALLQNISKALDLARQSIPPLAVHVWDVSSNQNYSSQIDIPHILQHVKSTSARRRWTKNATSDKLAFICFSSGTSGLVKGVKLSHGNVVANIFQQKQGLSGMFTPETVMVLAVPFFHVLGLSGFCCQYLCQVSSSSDYTSQLRQADDERELQLWYSKGSSSTNYYILSNEIEVSFMTDAKRPMNVLTGQQ
jgi:acyl-CoA synthetase (AMP-forming)/AMP-acid ligase II